MVMEFKVCKACTIDDLDDKAKRKAISNIFDAYWDELVLENLRDVIREFIRKAAILGIIIHDSSVSYDLEGRQCIRIQKHSTNFKVLTRIKDESTAVLLQDNITINADDVECIRDGKTNALFDIDVSENIVVTKKLYKVCKKCTNLIAGAIDGSCSKKNCKIINIVIARCEKSWNKYLNLVRETLTTLIKTAEDSMSDYNAIEFARCNEFLYFKNGDIIKEVYYE